MYTDTIADDSRLIELAAIAAQSFRQLVQRAIVQVDGPERCRYYVQVPIQTGRSELPESPQIRKAVETLIQIVNKQAPDATECLLTTPLDHFEFSAQVKTHNLAIRICHNFSMLNNQWETWLDVAFGFASERR